MMRRVLVIGVVVAAALIGLSPPSSPLLGVVIDAQTREPVVNAIVTAGSAETRTDARGMFRVGDVGTPTVRVRASGYGRAEVSVDSLRRPPGEIRLPRVRPKALYLSVFGIGNRTLREAALELVDTTELNALVTIERFVHALLVRSMQLSVCNAFHEIEGRCMRWLLAVDDLVRNTEIPLTHEGVAMMLGVRRSTVTLVPGSLQRAGLIRERRGRIVIKDRARLQAATCECYRVMRDEPRRLLGY